MVGTWNTVEKCLVCSQRPAASWVLFCMTRNGALETAQGLGGDSASRGSLFCSCLCSYLIRLETTKEIYRKKKKKKQYINFYRIFPLPFLSKVSLLSVVTDFAVIITLLFKSQQETKTQTNRKPLWKRAENKRFPSSEKEGVKGRGLFCFLNRTED